MAKELTQEQAKRLADSKFWEAMTDRERAEFQLWQDRLCMPWPVFHEAVEKSLGRPVYTHEFGLDLEGLRREFLGGRPAPSLDEILNLIPADKRIVVVSPSSPPERR